MSRSDVEMGRRRELEEGDARDRDERLHERWNS